MKTKWIQLVFLTFIILSVSHLTVWGTTGEKDLVNCTNNIKAIVQGLELWANDHSGHFPSQKEFSSPKFLEYIKKTSAGEPRAKMKDPLSGKPFLYQPFESKKDYFIKCPAPELYGLEKCYYSRINGFISVKMPEKPASVAQKTSPAPGASEKPQEKPLDTTPTKEPEKSPAPTEKPVPAKTTEAKYDALADPDKEKMTVMIKDLYDAYEQRDLERILTIQKDAIEASAIDYEKRKKGTADEVREAFRDATKEIIEHKDFKMKPLNMGDLTFQRKGKYCKVTSIVPIIASERLEVEEEGKYFFVRLRIGEFIFEQEGEIWKIINMYLY